MDKIPPVSLIESSLYVKDVDRAGEWYGQLFGFPTLLKEEGRLRALEAGERQVLLLFSQGGSVHGAPMPTGYIPPHDGSGPVHMAFSMSCEDVGRWRDRLHRFGIPIESTIEWPEGGTSFYFRDPDGHLLELITPQQWKFSSRT